LRNELHGRCEIGGHGHRHFAGVGRTRKQQDDPKPTGLNFQHDVSLFNFGTAKL
jgi:hypothetical protein